jgi:hypothetical protein
MRSVTITSRGRPALSGENKKRAIQGFRRNL